MTRFKHYPQRPARLTPDFVRAEYRPILEGLPAADAAADAGPWLAAIERWNALRSYVEGERARSHYAYCRNCLDPAMEEADRYLREEIVPAHEAGESLFLQALARTPHRGGIAARHGRYFLDRMAAGQEAVATVNSDLRVQLGELATQYDKAVAAGEVTVRGEPMTLTRAVGSPSRPRTASCGARRSRRTATGTSSGAKRSPTCMDAWWHCATGWGATSATPASRRSGMPG